MSEVMNGFEAAQKKRRDTSATNDSLAKQALTKCLAFVLNNKHLNPVNRAYIERIDEKVHTGKRPTDNEIAGLFKIERGILHAVRVENKAILDSAKRIGEDSEAKIETVTEEERVSHR